MRSRRNNKRRDDDKEKFEIKKTITEKQSKRNRREWRISLRKKRREGHIMKRRKLDPSEHVGKMFEIPPEFKGNLNAYMKYLKEELGKGQKRTLQATIKMRKMLAAADPPPPIKEIVSTGVVPALTHLFIQNDDHRIKVEAAWCLCNITSLDTNEKVEFKGQMVSVSQRIIELIGEQSNGKFYDIALEQLVKESDNIEFVDNTMYLIGNVMGENSNCRDYFVSRNVIKITVKLLEQYQEELRILVNGVAIIANSMRAKPKPKFEMIQPCLPLLQHLLHHPSSEVKEHVFWSYSYMSDWSQDFLWECLEKGITKHLMTFLDSKNPKLISPALRFVGSYTDLSDPLIEKIVDMELPKHLSRLIHHSKKSIRKESIWALSNLMASTTKVLEITFKTKVCDDFIAVSILEKLKKDSIVVKDQCVWFFGNTFGKAPKEALDYMIMKLRVIDVLFEELKVNDKKYLDSLLRAINELLVRGKEISQKEGIQDKYKSMIQKTGKVERIVQLQNNADETIRNLSMKLIRDFFPEEETLMGDEDNGLYDNQGGFGGNQGGGFGGMEEEPMTPMHNNNQTNYFDF